MVLIRTGRDGVTRGNDKSKMLFYEDTVWSMPRDAALRSKQLEDAGYFTIVDEKRFTNAPTEHVVWSSQSKRKGTRFAKKTARRKAHKDMLEGGK